MCRHAARCLSHSALAHLASASGVSREREEFMELVEKEIDRWGVAWVGDFGVWMGLGMCRAGHLPCQADCEAVVEVGVQPGTHNTRRRHF